MWKLWRAPTTYLSLKLRTRFLLTNIYKSMFKILFILSRSWVICKNKKRPDFHTLVFYIFINNSRSKQSKNPEQPCADIFKLETCGKFQQKKLNFVVVGARQSFQFFRQIAWFLENNRAFSRFRYRFLYNLTSITKLWKNHSIKSNFD